MSAWPSIKYLAATGQLGPFNVPTAANAAGLPNADMHARNEMFSRYLSLMNSDPLAVRLAQLALESRPVVPTAATDPNADMLQKDSKGALDQGIRDLVKASLEPDVVVTHEPDPGDNLLTVAPMDGRLGRFREPA